MLNKTIYSLVCILVLTLSVNSQTDTTKVNKNIHSPKTATIMSACLPGLGQVYNKSYWKVPVIYAGFFTVGYFYVENQKNYTAFRDSYNNYRDTYTNLGISAPSDTLLNVFNIEYSPYTVKEGRDFYRRRRDLSLILGGSWYVLNIIEAYVDAHLFTFDVSDDLTLYVRPPLYFNNKTYTGFTLQFTF